MIRLIEQATFGHGNYGLRCVVCLADDYNGQIRHKPGCALATQLVIAVREGRFPPDPDQ